MKLYDGGRAPNPRRVRIFLAEKSVVPDEVVQVDLNRLEHKSAAFMALNPTQTVPVLVLDDGTALGETVAICRYVEEALAPAPNLMGTDARERAIIEMWNRRMELGLFLQVAAVFRHLHPGAAALEVPQVTAWGEVNREKVMETLGRLDAHLANHPYIAADRFTIADITAGIAVDFMKPSQIALPEHLAHVRRWHADVAARPSWRA